MQKQIQKILLVCEIISSRIVSIKKRILLNRDESAVSMLTNIITTLHITKKDFLLRNCIHSKQ